MFDTQVLQQVKTESRQAVTVRYYQLVYLTCEYAINQRKELRALKVQPPADLFDKLDVSDTFDEAEILQNRALILEIRALGL